MCGIGCLVMLLLTAAGTFAAFRWGQKSLKQFTGQFGEMEEMQKAGGEREFPEQSTGIIISSTDTLTSMDPTSKSEQNLMPTATPFKGMDVWLSVSWSDATAGALLRHEVYRDGKLVPKLSDPAGKGLRIDAFNTSGTTKWKLDAQQLQPGLHEARIIYKDQVVAIKRFMVMEMPFGIQMPQPPPAAPPAESPKQPR